MYITENWEASCYHEDLTWCNKISVLSFNWSIVTKQNGEKDIINNPEILESYGHHS